jgi:hypothetical protein
MIARGAMRRAVLLYVTGAAVILAAGLAHGHWTGRWGNGDAIMLAAVAIDRVPRSVGDWVGNDESVDADTFARAGADRYLVRRYENRVTGAAVSVMLVCGRPGSICVHTPDACYDGNGFAQKNEKIRETFSIGPRSAEFWAADLRKIGSGTGEMLTIHYAWRSPADESWSAPQNSRIAFIRAPALYKLYVLHGSTTVGGQSDTDPTGEFVAELLPALEQSVFSTQMRAP